MNYLEPLHLLWETSQHTPKPGNVQNKYLNIQMQRCPLHSLASISTKNVKEYWPFFFLTLYTKPYKRSFLVSRWTFTKFFHCLAPKILVLIWLRTNLFVHIGFFFLYPRYFLCRNCLLLGSKFNLADKITKSSRQHWKKHRSSKLASEKSSL